MLGTIFILSSVGFLLCDARCPTEAPIGSLPEVLPPKEADGWRLVGSLDVLDTNQKCPSQLWPYVKKLACGRKDAISSVIVPTGSKGFQQVCGRFRAFQVGSPDGFRPAGTKTIDEAYVDGISITYNDGGKRQHVFTYAVGISEHNLNKYVCPCAGGEAPPAFVGTTDYLCESGNPTKDWANELYCDPLWDGKECRFDEKSCCNSRAQIHPWFCKDLGKLVQSDLEIRICGDEGTNNEDIALEAYELFVR